MIAVLGLGSPGVVERELTLRRGPPELGAGPSVFACRRAWDHLLFLLTVHARGTTEASELIFVIVWSLRRSAARCADFREYGYPFGRSGGRRPLTLTQGDLFVDPRGGHSNVKPGPTESLSPGGR